MKNIIKTFLIISIVLTTYSCSDDYFDINTPGNVIPDANKNLKDLLGPAIYYTFDAQYAAATRVSLLTQYTSSALNSSVGVDNHYEESLDSYWSSAYVKALGNLKEVADKADETKSSHYKGIVQILQAVNFGLLTDLYGDIPFSQASLAAQNFKPEYDRQEEVYKGINNLLDQGIANLSAPNTSSFAPGKEDLVYGGNVEKWIKAAYSFKARYALHLSKINATTAASTVVSYLAKGITSNADDFQLIYNKVQTNPWYNNQLGLNTGNASYLITKQFIGFMNGSTFTFKTVTMDPRMPLLIDLRSYPVTDGVVNPKDPNPNVPGNYIGGEPGQGSKGTPAPNAKIGLYSYYSKIDSPVVILSFSEVKLMQAEAQFVLNGGNATSTGTNAIGYSAYMDAVGANMDKLGVSGPDKNSYLGDASINKGAANLQLKDIMRQKNIALYLNCETFNDYRRYDFSTNVFPGLTLPKAADPANGGKWIRRFIYSTNERNANKANYELNFKSMVTPVWWDK
ncbi:SusD/RagB family nutrient-binding outer membrane lipoprotein [Flavobacterium collinsii]|uniref:SusD/RagB family nutrient-binding outer membrane lipoprotein n=1 Tax=Flavobacterium collinsii TaxID=1114861 RepID=UPI00375772E9